MSVLEKLYRYRISEKGGGGKKKTLFCKDRFLWFEKRDNVACIQRNILCILLIVCESFFEMDAVKIAV
jgi:hypothetical protein